MKTRESGMPDEERWKSFFDPMSILESLELSSDSQQVVDMGCGYGTFSIPAALRIAGRVYMQWILTPRWLLPANKRARNSS